MKLLIYVLLYNKATKMLLTNDLQKTNAILRNTDHVDS